DRAFDGRATACLRTSLGVPPTVTSVTSAFTLDRPNGDHLELPVVRRLRQPSGAFDRHGLVAGNLTGFTPGAEQRLRTTRLLEFGEWFDDTMLGVPLATALPV